MRCDRTFHRIQLVVKFAAVFKFIIAVKSQVVQRSVDGNKMMRSKESEAKEMCYAFIRDFLK
jgi:hypothetical protein